MTYSEDNEPGPKTTVRKILNDDQRAFRKSRGIKSPLLCRSHRVHDQPPLARSNDQIPAMGRHPLHYEWWH